jgi:hypothetical protein
MGLAGEAIQEDTVGPFRSLTTTRIASREELGVEGGSHLLLATWTISIRLLCQHKDLAQPCRRYPGVSLQ